MKAYFKYEVYTRCNIPAIHLAGTQADWQSVRTRASALAEFDQSDAPLTWWLKPLLLVLDRFVAAYDGDIDEAFWCSIYKLSGTSGGDCVTGWINILFPYSRTEKHGVVEMWDDADSAYFFKYEGIKTNQFPSGVTCAPFTWHYYADIFNMEFLGGFMVTAWEAIEGRLVIRPVVGWAVRDPAAPATIKKNRYGEEVET